jgi:hypothetical protein
MIYNSLTIVGYDPIQLVNTASLHDVSFSTSLYPPQLLVYNEA